MAPKNSKKTATAKPVTSAKPPAPPAEVDTSKLPLTDPRRRLTKDEIKSLTPEQRKARREARAATRAPLKQRVSRKVEKTAKGLDRIVKMLGDQDVAKTLAEAVKGLRAAAGDILDLPDDWRPKGAPAPSRSFADGSKVSLVEGKRDQFAQFLEPSDMDALTVVKTVGKKVVVQTPGKVKLFLPAAVLRAVA